MGQREGPSLGLVEAISSVFNTNPIPTPVNLEDVSGFCTPRTSASTLLEWLTLSPPNPALGGTVKAEQKRDACCLPTTSPPRTFPSRQCGGCSTPNPLLPQPSRGRLGEGRARRLRHGGPSVGSALTCCDPGQSTALSDFCLFHLENRLDLPAGLLGGLN